MSSEALRMTRRSRNSSPANSRRAASWRHDNVAALIAFLCSDAGRDINGAAIPIDGGWSPHEYALSPSDD